MKIVKDKMVKNVTKGDINVIMKYDAKIGEMSKARNMIRDLEKTYDSQNSECTKMCMMLFAYKLGEMQGKRQERARKRKVGVING